MLRKTFHTPTIGIATSHERLSVTLRILSGLALAVALISPDVMARPSPDFESPCGEPPGLQRARCERQRDLQAICGATSGDARSHCERCFIAVNPIPCEPYNGDDRRQHDAELEALPACSDGPIETFMACLIEALSASLAAITARR